MVRTVSVKTFLLRLTALVLMVVCQITNYSHSVSSMYSRYPGVVDGDGRGCILTPTTMQWQCDQGAQATGNFSVGCDGSFMYNGNNTFWSCPTGDHGGYNVYTIPIPGQQGCVNVTMTADSCQSGCPSPQPPPPPPASAIPTPPAPSSTASAPPAPTPTCPGSPSCPTSVCPIDLSSKFEVHSH